MYFVYKFTLKPTNKIFIGRCKSETFDIDPFNISNYSTWLNAIIGYNKEDIFTEILTVADNNIELRKQYKYWLEVYNSKDPAIGYNWWKLTDEQRKRWSEVATGHFVSDETKKKMSDSAKKVSHRPMTEEEKAAQSERVKLLRATTSPIWNKGKHLSDDQKKSISKTLKGRPSPNKGKKRSEETNRKINETKRKRGTFNSSSEENKVFELLKIHYGEEDIIRGYSTDSRYPFQCDFYIKSEDKFIECNFHWTHGFRPYIKDDPQCIDQLNDWKIKSESSQYYENAIYCWTDLDVRKITIARKNKLNYKTYYSLSEVKEEYGK